MHHRRLGLADPGVGEDSTGRGPTGACGGGNELTRLGKLLGHARGGAGDEAAGDGGVLGLAGELGGVGELGEIGEMVMTCGWSIHVGEPLKVDLLPQCRELSLIFSGLKASEHRDGQGRYRGCAHDTPAPN